MTARRWTNDYGDVPRWYWVVRPILIAQVRAEERRRARAVIAAIASAVVGL